MDTGNMSEAVGDHQRAAPNVSQTEQRARANSATPGPEPEQHPAPPALLPHATQQPRVVVLLVAAQCTGGHASIPSSHSIASCFYGVEQKVGQEEPGRAAGRGGRELQGCSLCCSPSAVRAQDMLPRPVVTPGWWPPQLLHASIAACSGHVPVPKADPFQGKAALVSGLQHCGFFLALKEKLRHKAAKQLARSFALLEENMPVLPYVLVDGC